MDFQPVIEKLYESDLKSDNAKKMMAFLYKNRRGYIPFWYQLQLKYLCKLFEYTDMDDVNIPYSVGDISLYYSLNYDEMQKISGDNAVYTNAYFVDDNKFIESSAYHYSVINQQYPGFAILFENKLAFVSKENLEKHRNTETKEKLPIDTSAG